MTTPNLDNHPTPTNPASAGQPSVKQKIAQHNLTDQNTAQSFISQVLNVWQQIFNDKGCLMMMLLAPIFYGFFYPLPYKTEVVRDVPVAIIDDDHSPLSTNIINHATASPRLDVQVAQNEHHAQELMWQNTIAGYMVIPKGLYQHVNMGQPAKVSVLANGNYFLLNKQVQTGFLEVVGTVSAGIKIQKAIATGQDSTLAKQNVNAISLTINPLYNTTEGYGSYVVPPVSMLILQQMYLMGTAMLVGTWVENRTHRTTFKGWLARILALSCLGFWVGCFYYGWVFPSHDYPRNQNLLGSLGLLMVYFPAVIAMGCLLGIWLGSRERAMQILVASSMPLLFLSGVTWPTHMLPEPLLYLRWVFPSTSAMNASVMLNQMGVPLADVAHYLATLLVIFLLCLLGLVWVGTEPSKPIFHKINHRI